MQVTETLSQGLKREFQVVLPAAELEERLSTELSTLKDKVKINGFRPGKVPVAHLRRLYGRSVMADVLQNAVNEANRKIVDDNQFKLASSLGSSSRRTRARSSRPWTPRRTSPSRSRSRCCRPSSSPTSPTSR
jgi:FKBP-type peptidyl-prolyl cis-trans isomerase (trigger factor)